MRIAGTPPAHLAAALRSIGRIPEEARSHPACRETFRNSCIQSSLIGAEALRRSGFTDAKAVSTKLLLQATDATGNHLDRRVVGSDTGHPRLRAGVWNGHMVILCGGFLIDLSLGQFSTTVAKYPEALALPLLPAGQPSIGRLNQLARIRYSDSKQQLSFDIGWLHTPDNLLWSRMESGHEKQLSAAIRKFVLDRVAT